MRLCRSEPPARPTEEENLSLETNMSASDSDHEEEVLDLSNVSSPASIRRLAKILVAETHTKRGAGP